MNPYEILLKVFFLCLFSEITLSQNLKVQSTYSVFDQNCSCYQKIPKEKYNLDSQGKKHGQYFRFNEQGEIIEKAIYSHGLKNGYYEYTGAAGPNLKGQYVNGSRHGEWEVIESDDLALKEYVNSGMTNGNKEFLSYIKIEYINGEIQERFSFYDKNYELKKEYIPYKNGLKNGEYKRYNKEGKILNKGYYKKNKKDSLWEVYHYSEKDELVYKSGGNYDNGIKVGSWEEVMYDLLTNEVLIVKGEYNSNGKKTGVWLNFGIYYPSLDTRTGTTKWTRRKQNNSSINYMGNREYKIGPKSGWYSKFDNGNIIKSSTLESLEKELRERKNISSQIDENWNNISVLLEDLGFESPKEDFSFSKTTNCSFPKELYHEASVNNVPYIKGSSVKGDVARASCELCDDLKRIIMNVKSTNPDTIINYIDYKWSTEFRSNKSNLWLYRDLVDENSKYKSIVKRAFVLSASDCRKIGEYYLDYNEKLRKEKTEALELFADSLKSIPLSGDEQKLTDTWVLHHYEKESNKRMISYTLRIQFSDKRVYSILYSAKDFEYVEYNGKWNPRRTLFAYKIIGMWHLENGIVKNWPLQNELVVGSKDDFDIESYLKKGLIIDKIKRNKLHILIGEDLYKGSQE